ncbi:MAG: AAA family ATPase, partial [Spirochaetaceae bacterium]|nr:AAA family ATPase [Spirochaetaceae bacterium]
MYIRRLKLKNYRLFNEVDVSFQHGMNVLIGKNSTGKSAILEAIDFLLSNDNANIPEEEIIPYSKRNDQSVHIRIDGIFEMSDLEKAGICSILDDADDRGLVANSNMEIIYTKTITKSGKNIRIDRNIQTNGNGISNRPDIITRVTNSLLPKLQTNNAIRITDADANNGTSQLLPLNQLAQMAPRQSNFLYQYVRNALYDMKQNSAGEFNKI